MIKADISIPVLIDIKSYDQTACCLLKISIVMVKSVILCQVGKGFHFQKSIANKVSSWVPDPPGAPLARVPGGLPPQSA